MRLVETFIKSKCTLERKSMLTPEPGEEKKNYLFGTCRETGLGQMKQ